MMERTLRLKSLGGICAAFGLLTASPAFSASIIADVVLDFFDSGAGPLAGPYGGNTSTFPIALADFSNVTDGSAGTFVSLPTGTFITLGFSGSAVVKDGTGDDIFISETGIGGEFADIFVSSDRGLTFTFLGTASNDTLSSFDLADIGFTGFVNAIKVVGLDNGGSSPGFDLEFVEGLEGSTAVVPLPATLPLMIGGIAAFGWAARRQRG